MSELPAKTTSLPRKSKGISKQQNILAKRRGIGSCGNMCRIPAGHTICVELYMWGVQKNRGAISVFHLFKCETIRN
jgi:hypothetical protein